MNGFGEIQRIITAEWTRTPGGIESACLAAILAFVLGQVIGWSYMRTHSGVSYSRMFTVSLVVLPIIVALVMLVMIDNIVIAFGLFAVFAIVRFRNIVKDTRDTSFVLWAIVVGLATGTMRFSLAVLGSAFLASVYWYLHIVSYGVRNRFDALLSLRWTGDAHSLNGLDALIRRHASRLELATQRTDPGRGVDFTYRLQLRDPARSNEMLVELRETGRVEDASLYHREEETEI